MLLLLCVIVSKSLVPKREWGGDGTECIRTQNVKVRTVS
jgi:hypothetical protein